MSSPLEPAVLPPAVSAGGVPPPGPGKRDAALDGLRGVAIAVILWHHLLAPFLPRTRESWLSWIWSGSNLAWCGVDLFFVLSGFFIGGILLDHRNSARLGRTFYLRRAIRILPLYYLTLGALLVLVAAGLPSAYRSFSAEVYFLFLTNVAVAASQGWDWLPFSVLWSLAVEEQFYLTAPWVVRAISPSRLPWLLVALVGGAWFARIVASGFFQAGEYVIHPLTPFRMDTLALGFLVAWAIRTPQADPFFEHLRRSWKRYLAAAVLALAGLSLLRPPEGGAVLAFGGYTVVAAAFATIVAIVVRVRPPALNRWLSASPLVLLGRQSYFIYLWHAIIGIYVIRFLLGENPRVDNPLEFAAVAAGVAATWGAAAVSWRFFEGPLIAWGQRWSYD